MNRPFNKKAPSYDDRESSRRLAGGGDCGQCRDIRAAVERFRNEFRDEAAARRIQEAEDLRRQLEAANQKVKQLEAQLAEAQAKIDAHAKAKYQVADEPDPQDARFSLLEVDD